MSVRMYAMGKRKMTDSEVAARKAWVCCECGHRLPTRGYVWSFRFEGFLDGRFLAGKDSGMVCDLCVEHEDE